MRKFKKVWNIITYIVLAFMILFICITIIGKLAGVKNYTVLSGSMEPRLGVGSLIYVKPVKPKDLKEKDIISFMINSDTVATHRIVKIKKGDDQALRFITKGDNNKEEDSGYVHEKNVIGKMIIAIPILGYIVTFIKSPLGVGIVLLILLTIAVTCFAMKNKEEQKNN